MTPPRPVAGGPAAPTPMAPVHRVAAFYGFADLDGLPRLKGELQALASHRITVPHSAAVESLNVAVSAAPLLLERVRQQSQRDVGGP